jgi:hypothetical protein
MNDDKLKQMLELVGEYRAEEAVVGSWLATEDKRNIDNLDLFEAMLREAYPDVTLVVAGHHIMAMRQGKPLPIEVASPDTLIFNHYIAQKIWGDPYLYILAQLAASPPAERDALLRQLFYNRKPQ